MRAGDQVQVGVAKHQSHNYNTATTFRTYFPLPTIRETDFCFASISIFESNVIDGRAVFPLFRWSCRSILEKSIYVRRMEGIYLECERQPRRWQNYVPVFFLMHKHLPWGKTPGMNRCAISFARRLGLHIENGDECLSAWLLIDLTWTRELEICNTEFRNVRARMLSCFRIGCIFKFSYMFSSVLKALDLSHNYPQHTYDNFRRTHLKFMNLQFHISIIEIRGRFTAALVLHYVYNVQQICSRY